MRILGGVPLASSSHSEAWRSLPSLSRPVISSHHGSAAAPPLRARPSLFGDNAFVLEVRRMRLSSTRDRRFFNPNSRAISRVPILPVAREMTGGSHPGPESLLALLSHLSAGLAWALLGDRLCRFRRRLSWLSPSTGARALLVASDFGFATDFFAAAFFCGFRRGCIRSGFCRSFSSPALSSRTLRLAPLLLRARRSARWLPPA